MKTNLIYKKRKKKVSASAIKTTEANVIALQEAEKLPALRQLRNR